MNDNIKIKTNIKFTQGLDNMAGRIYGFVTKTNGSWRGCREDEPRKKIVFVDSAIAPTIIPNVLYSCGLAPMRSDNGFIAKTASIIKFEATIVTSGRRGTYVVSVKFGNKLYVYNPADKKNPDDVIQRIANILRNRIDLEDANGVAEEFINQSCMAKHMYEQRKGNVH